MDYRKIHIGDLVESLRHQSDIPLWAIASCASIRAIAEGRPEHFGPRGRWIRALFELTGIGWLGLQALRLIGLGVVTACWFKSRGVSRCKSMPGGLFVGFGAGQEKQMFARIGEESGCNVVHLDQTLPSTFAVITRPPLIWLWRRAWDEAARVTRGLRQSNLPEIKEHAQDWLTSIAIRIGTYVFFSVWAEYLPSAIRRIVFISPDTPAFAVLAAARQSNRKMTIEFWQHGLLRISVVLPKFDKVVALNKPEAEHIRTVTGCPHVVLVSDRVALPLATARPILLFASVYDFVGFSKSNHVELLREVFAWAGRQNLQVIVRLHPCEEEGFWTNFASVVTIDRSGGSFEDCLERLAPKLVVSWFSTALVDALKGGVMPVLITPGSEQALADIVFPLDQIAVKWPEEKSQLESLLSGRVLYREQVMSRQDEAFGAKAIAG